MGRGLRKYHAAAVGPAEGAWVVAAGNSVQAGLLVLLLPALLALVLVLVLVLVLFVASDVRYTMAGGVGNHAVLISVVS